MKVEYKVVSTDPALFVSFFSFLFDIEVSTLEDCYHFTLFDLCIVIVKGQSPSERMLTFYLNTNEELLDLKSRIEFFYYKQGLSELQCSYTDDELIAQDPDGKAWVFSSGVRNC